jgi:hypothetical protein
MPSNGPSDKPGTLHKDDGGLWKLWETRSVGFPRSGGRVLGVHGSGSFHRPARCDYPRMT